MFTLEIVYLSFQRGKELVFTEYWGIPEAPFSSSSSLF